MKKLFIVALAVVLSAAFVMPASALENIFGGYWRTRFISQQNFSGDDGISEVAGAPGDLQRVDSRTRLYYTAKLNDNLKFVNKFEFNTTWGGTGGQIGTDGTGNLRIKHSYADFNVGSVNTKVGLQGITLNRGFLFDDDFAGLTITVPTDFAAFVFVWAKPYEGGTDDNIADVDYYVATSIMQFGDFKIQPYVTYATSNDASEWGKIGDVPKETSLDAWYLSLDMDYSAENFGVWLTGIWQLGDFEVPGSSDTNLKGALVALGGNVDLGMFDIHSQIFWASGDDEDDTDSESVDAFFMPKGQSYYWSEIMGLGMFDQQASAGSCADGISNIIAFNLGTTVDVNEKLSITGDVWYAQHAEDVNNEDKLGTEVDLVVTYQLIENLKLDLVGAYLFADDATSMDGTNDENPYEVGARLSLSF